MVYSEFNPDTGSGYIVLKPNNSASWHFNILVVASFALLALLISTFFLLQGLWLIAPFSGLEVLALLGCLYLCARSNIQTEVIKFSPDKVVMNRGAPLPRNHGDTTGHGQKYLCANPGTKVIQIRS